MEPEEILYIDQNLAELTVNTSCTDALIIQLISAGVLSSENKEELQRSNITATTKNEKLYTILKTRIDGFDVLKKALENTKQSGALKILLNFTKTYKYYGSISVDPSCQLGRGRHGKVFKGMFGGREVAVKRLNCTELRPEKAMKEIDFLKKLDHHQNIIRYFNAEETKDYFFIALELCSTDLHNWVTKERKVAMTEIEILRQSTCGIAFLHQCNIIHQDLKPENILLNFHGQIKVSDFGISKVIPEGQSSVSFCSSEIGTHGWMSPEVLSRLVGNSTNRLTAASDIFSLGCIFYFVLSNGMHLFGDIIRRQANIIENKPVNLVAHKHLPADILTLIETMISNNPKKRPSAQFVQQHRTLRNHESSERVNKQVLVGQLRTKESYRRAVDAALEFYANKMQHIFSSIDFLSDDDLNSQHQLVFTKSLQFYKDTLKLGIPDTVELEAKMEQEYKKLQKTNVQNRKLVYSQAQECVTECQRKYMNAINWDSAQMRTVEELEELHKDAHRKAKDLFQEKCPHKQDKNFVRHYETQLEDFIADTNDERIAILKRKRGQEEMTKKTVRFYLLKLYKDKMQKHCQNSNFLRPDQLTRVHKKASLAAITNLVEKVPLTSFQRRNLEQELESMYEKYKNEYYMKLNCANGVTPAIGIDMGFTYCRVAVYYNGIVIVIPDYDMENFNNDATACCVICHPDGARETGNVAKKYAYRHPGNTIYDVMHIIGGKADDLQQQQYTKNWCPKVVDENGILKINVAGNLLLPEQICAELLSHLRVLASEHLGLNLEHLNKAVITVPTYFTDCQRQTMKKAGELAGLEVLCLLNEPTAAVIAYSLERLDNAERKVLVFGLGRTTFNVAVLHESPCKIDVLGVDEDAHLGGEDFDQKMTQHCAERFLEMDGIDLMAGKDSKDFRISYKSQISLRRLQRKCEQAKIWLSFNQQSVVCIIGMEGTVDLRVLVTREKFEELNMPLFQQAIDIVDRLLGNCGIRKQDLDDIVLVGGSTRIPKIREMLRTYFEGKVLKDSICPEETVVYGAAIKAAMVNGEQAIGTIDWSSFELLTPRQTSVGSEAKETGANEKCCLV